MGVIFENPGEADVLALTTFGVNVKESTSPIGFFGTGFKYAVAVLLRTGHRVRLFTGQEEIEFRARKEIIRGKEFGLVCMEGASLPDHQRLGFTTDLGKHWETWMAYRELHCNAKDEGGRVFVADEAQPEAGITRIVIEGEAIERAHTERAEFILESEPLHVSNGIEVHPGPSRFVYYRGIRIHEIPKERTTAFAYNFTRKVDLTEDRVAKYPWMIDTWLRDAIICAEDQGFAETALTAKEHRHEHHLEFNDAYVTPGGGFVAALENLSDRQINDVNPSAYTYYKKSTRSRLNPDPTEITPVQRQMLDRAVTFCRSLGFRVDDYKIVPVIALGERTLAVAAQSTIYLATGCFDRGTKQVAAALVEEYVHLDTGYEDESRELQTYLFNKLVSLGEELQGEAL